MVEDRNEHETMQSLKISEWKTDVGGESLGQLVTKWYRGNKKAEEKILRLMSQGDEMYQLIRRVESLFSDGPFFPGNHKDFDRLPEGLACTMCNAFSGIVKMENGFATIKCEWPDKKVTTRMRLDSKLPGGAVDLNGNCGYRYGIAKRDDKDL